MTKNVSFYKYQLEDIPSTSITTKEEVAAKYKEIRKKDTKINKIINRAFSKCARMKIDDIYKNIYYN